MAQATAKQATIKNTAQMGKSKGSPGVIGKSKSSYVTVKDVMFYLGCSRSKAYGVMSGLREELISSGQMYEGVPVGKLPKHYFFERCMIEE